MGKIAFGLNYIMQRAPKFLAVIVCAVIVSVGAVPVPMGPSGNLILGVSEAKSQERKKGFFELLFQGGKKKAEPKPQVRKKTTAKPRKKAATKKTVRKKTVRKKTVRKKATKKTVRRASAAAVPAAPKVETIEKLENANRVLVIGDFVADGMSEGLTTAFADVPNVIIESRTNGSSGLVRDDFYDWKTEIGPIIEEVKPTIVVVMLGSNDRQVMRINGKSQDVRSDIWLNEYKSRVTGLVSAIRQKNVPVMWTSSPSFKFRSMTADILAFNEVYRQITETSGGYFVDIWDGFVDEQGKFITTGPDIKGQNVRLRLSDGINFTRAGKRKMAFYVERQLKQLLGDATTPLLSSLSGQNAPLMTLPPLQTEADLERTNPIAFNDPDLDGGNILLGDITAKVESKDNPLQAKSVRRRLVEDGVPPPSQDGRAGNFVQ